MSEDLSALRSQDHLELPGYIISGLGVFKNGIHEEYGDKLLAKHQMLISVTIHYIPVDTCLLVTSVCMVSHSNILAVTHRYPHVPLQSMTCVD